MWRSGNGKHHTGYEKSRKRQRRLRDLFLLCRSLRASLVKLAPPHGRYIDILSRRIAPHREDGPVVPVGIGEPAQLPPPVTDRKRIVRVLLIHGSVVHGDLDSVDADAAVYIQEPERETQNEQGQGSQEKPLRLSAERNAVEQLSCAEGQKDEQQDDASGDQEKIHAASPPPLSLYCYRIIIIIQHFCQAVERKESRP